MKQLYSNKDVLKKKGIDYPTATTGSRNILNNNLRSFFIIRVLRDFFNKFILFLFIFGCVGSLLLHAGFL